MATELTVQSERAFQKQPHIFLNSKTKAKSSKKADKTRRWYKEVGLGFRTPLTAIEGSYIGMHDSRILQPARDLREFWSFLKMGREAKNRAEPGLQKRQLQLCDND
jgi:small subunit ribosomal protein S11e